jgi:pyruvate/2-oxoglutarate dehydrogenase complex dihydrolipoamide acyltransferase (E2) component
MARAIVMPSFGMYTAEGTLTAWRKPTGTFVNAGEVVVEVETEKALQEIEAPAAGFLHHVLAAGARLQVETLIGYILLNGEAPPDQSFTGGTSVSDPPSGVPSEQATPIPTTLEPRASPIAKRLAREHGIDLTRIQGTGPDGRIVEADVRAAIDNEGGGDV